eukprot:8626623-Alexandrium_andersonii.AAC.1
MKRNSRELEPPAMDPNHATPALGKTTTCKRSEDQNARPLTSPGCAWQPRSCTPKNHSMAPR